MKNFNPSVSNITRIKNHENWICQCISMIKKQTYKNYETIILNIQCVEKNGR